ncbi:MAG: DUF983 domain-containing protein [Thermoplasmatota archaeon]
MFSAWTVERERCPVCGISFEPSRGEFTGAMMFAQGFFGTLGLGFWFILFITVGMPLWASLLWILLFGAVIPGLTYRNAKGAWTGAMYAFGGLNRPGPDATYHLDG